MARRPISAARAGDTTPSETPQQLVEEPTPTGVAALLLEVLHKVNQEVRTTPELKEKARAAVAHYQDIAASLKTLADRPASSPAVSPATAP